MRRAPGFRLEGCACGAHCLRFAVTSVHSPMVSARVQRTDTVRVEQHRGMSSPLNHGDSRNEKIPARTFSGDACRG